MTGAPHEPPGAGGARGGIFAKLLVLLAGLAALVALAWMLFLPALLARAIEARTGFGVRIERMGANPFTARIDVQGFALDNPPAYPSRDFVQIRAFQADADLFSLFSERPVFDRMQLDVACVAVIRHADGRSNLDEFRTRWSASGSDGRAGSPATQPGPPAKRTAFLIKRLDVRFDRLTLIDLATSRMAPRDVNLDFEHTYTNVTDPAQLLVPAVFRRLGEAGVLFDAFRPRRSAAAGGGLAERPGGGIANRLKTLLRTLEDSGKP